jgi:hypothetical protein
MMQINASSRRNDHHGTSEADARRVHLARVPIALIDFPEFAVACFHKELLFTFYFSVKTERFAPCTDGARLKLNTTPTPEGTGPVIRLSFSIWSSTRQAA